MGDLHYGLLTLSWRLFRFFKMEPERAKSKIYGATIEYRAEKLVRINLDNRRIVLNAKFRLLLFCHVRSPGLCSALPSAERERRAPHPVHPNIRLVDERGIYCAAMRLCEMSQSSGANGASEKRAIREEKYGTNVNCFLSGHAPDDNWKPRLVASADAAYRARGAGGQPSRPQIETMKVEGTENVYIFRNGNHQAMFIVTPEGVIATDPVAYGRPTGGQQYIDEIKKVTQAPIRYLIYSHHHFDHIAGGKAFKDAGATIVAHKRAKERLEVLKDPHTPLPDETIDTDRTITLGGTALELSYVGLNHSDSTLVMRLPREKIVFIVDLLPVGRMPGRGMIDFYPLEAEELIKKVLGMDWDRLIPGHPDSGGRLGTRQDAQEQLTLLQEASAEMKKLGQEGKCWDTAEKEFKLPKYATWPGYDQGLPFVARRYCGLWGRGT